MASFIYCKEGVKMTREPEELIAGKWMQLEKEQLWANEETINSWEQGAGW